MLAQSWEKVNWRSLKYRKIDNYEVDLTGLIVSGKGHNEIAAYGFILFHLRGVE